MVSNSKSDFLFPARSFLAARAVEKKANQLLLPRAPIQTRRYGRRLASAAAEERLAGSSVEDLLPPAGLAGVCWTVIRAARPHPHLRALVYNTFLCYISFRETNRTARGRTESFDVVEATTDAARHFSFYVTSSWMRFGTKLAQKHLPSIRPTRRPGFEIG